MTPEKKWKIIHDYRRAVRRGQAEPYRCSTDDTELVTVLGTNDLPALKCYLCYAVTTPGLNMYEEMESRL